MSATERLRELLDERGVEHEGGERSMRWRDRYGVMMQAFPLANGELGMEVWSCTPEQAIAATLGSADTYTREEVEGAFVSGYSLGLDMFDHSKPDFDKGWNQTMRHLDEEMAERGWVRKEAATSSYATADGTLHIRCLALPKRVKVTLPDSRRRDVYSAKVHLFEPERETCHKVRVHTQIEDEMHCSECGRFLGFCGDLTAPPTNYCPACGRKVVSE